MTFEDFTEEMRPLHNQMCIVYDMHIARIVGVARDDCDYYYILRGLKQPRGQDQEYWGTAVGHIESLEGRYPAERYAYMNEVFEMNGAGPSEEFLVIDRSAEDSSLYFGEAEEDHPDAALSPERVQRRIDASPFTLVDVGLSYELHGDQADLFAGNEAALERVIREALPAVQSAFWPSDSGESRIIFQLTVGEMRNRTLRDLEVLVEGFIEDRITALVDQIPSGQPQA